MPNVHNGWEIVQEFRGERDHNGTGVHIKGLMEEWAFSLDDKRQN